MGFVSQKLSRLLAFNMQFHPRRLRQSLVRHPLKLGLSYLELEGCNALDKDAWEVRAM